VPRTGTTMSARSTAGRSRPACRCTARPRRPGRPTWPASHTPGPLRLLPAHPFPARLPHRRRRSRQEADRAGLAPGQPAARTTPSPSPAPVWSLASAKARSSKTMLTAAFAAQPERLPRCGMNPKSSRRISASKEVGVVQCVEGLTASTPRICLISLRLGSSGSYDCPQPKVIT
jgi:hypothetical protein